MFYYHRNIANTYTWYWNISKRSKEANRFNNSPHKHSVHSLGGIPYMGIKLKYKLNGQYCTTICSNGRFIGSWICKNECKYFVNEDKKKMMVTCNYLQYSLPEDLFEI